MCGICGFTNATKDKLDILIAMCDEIKHRGPDGEGQFIENGIALGHRRLSLIDLNGGHQPMIRHGAQNMDAQIFFPSKADGSDFSSFKKDAMSIVFNGEIYNYKELRKELEALGWKFATSSDTEVLLVSYMAWGRKSLQKLRGMFAFAIHNAQTGELFCARDFFGIKPFYYTSVKSSSAEAATAGSASTFIFASEIKSILKHPEYKRELNLNALEQYMCFQFSALEETFFKGIFKLPAAHCMTVSAQGKVEIHKYWNPDFKVNSSLTAQEASQKIDEAIRESVKYHNVADVEVGSFLSSGIDSSYMAACLAKENPDIKTFTVGFQQYSGQRDEISWAQELAQELSVKNTSKHIGEDEYWEVLPKIMWHMDEPSADPSAVALYFVDQIAATQVKAVLSGEGADEFFGGYKIYQVPLANSKLSAIPRPLLRTGAAIAKKFGIRGANYLKRASMTPKDWYYTNANEQIFSPEEAASTLRHTRGSAALHNRPQEIVAPAYDEAEKWDEITQMQYVDIKHWLIGDILLKTDKMAMAHSLESRVPFLDKEVFDVARQIPASLRVSDSQTKICLRDASKNAIPQAWAQKEKLGFPVPIKDYLMQDKYYNLLKDCFTSAIASKFFAEDALVKLLDEHRAGSRDNSRRVWAVYMFILWYEVYFTE